VRPDVTAVDVLHGLRDHYRYLYRSSSLAAAVWLVLDEVRLSAVRRGVPGEDSRIDALAIRVDRGDPWLVGNEIKVDRRDLEIELATHTKREPWQKVTNAFDLVVPVGLTTAEEVEFSAPDLGLLEFDPETREIVRKRSGFSSREIPPPSWDLVVSLLRAATR
jgi:hypothetical protein